MQLTLSQRIQISFFMVVVFLLILGSNIMDRRNYADVYESVNSVYKDRVVVQGYIHELDNIFHEKELRLVGGGASTSFNDENVRISQLLVDFAATELTTKESQLLLQLNEQFEQLKDLELKTITDGHNNSVHSASINTLNKIEESLNGLTKVQLDQGNRLTLFSQKSMGAIALLSNIEIGFMVFIGVLIIIVIFYPFKSSRDMDLQA